MATAPTDDQAALARLAPTRDRRVTLRGVPWKVYEALRDKTDSGDIRMSYLDGTLTLMSPGIHHEDDLDWLALIVRGASAGMGLPLRSTGSATLRKGTARLKGAAKEPDQGFYVGDHVRPMVRWSKTGKKRLDLNVDPPPDLAIEVEHTYKARYALAIYAHLGVPEVWRYDLKAGSLHFHSLVGNAYVAVERSVVLPKLTTALVLQAFELADIGDMDENAFYERVKQWTIGLPDPPAPA